MTLYFQNIKFHKFHLVDAINLLHTTINKQRLSTIMLRSMHPDYKKFALRKGIMSKKKKFPKLGKASVNLND